jgi:hypothetical protein
MGVDTTNNNDLWTDCGIVNYGYDEGRLTYTSSNNSSTQTAWGLYGVKSSTGIDGLQTDYVYNRYHELLACIGEGKTTAFEYDKAGGMLAAVTKVINGDRQLRATFTLDDAGRQKTAKDELGT